MGDKYKFSNSQIGAIYSCWGWGYTLTQMPGGYFGQRIGSKKTWLYFMSAAAISSMLIPLAASTVGVLGVAVLNGISGMGQGPLYPVSAGLFGAWLPQPEYARGANAVWSMWSGGQMIQGNLSPWIMTHLGWEYAFYIYPALILLWAWVWNKYAHNTPAEDPACSEAECAYIEGTKPEQKEEETFGTGVYVVLLKQRSVLVFMLVQVIAGFTGAYTTWLPLYLEQQGGLELWEAGLVAATSFSGSVFGMWGGGFFADWITNKGVLSTDRIRKLSIVSSNLISFAICGVLAMGPPAFLIGVMLFLRNLLVDFVGAAGAPISVDMSPKYAAAIMGALNCANNLTFYAISANIIGYWLDAGGCRKVDAAANADPPQVWRMPGRCAHQFNITEDHRAESEACFSALGASDACGEEWAYSAEECTLTRLITEDPTVERAADCTTTWHLLWGTFSLCSLLAGLLFAFFGSSQDITAKVDREVAAYEGTRSAASNDAETGGLAGVLDIAAPVAASVAPVADVAPTTI